MFLAISERVKISNFHHSKCKKECVINPRGFFELQTKVFRQKYTLDRLNVLENMLIDQLSRHEVLALLVQRELNGLKAIKECLESIRKRQDDEQSLLAREKECVQNLKDAEGGVREPRPRL